MKLSTEENSKIVTQLAEAFITSIGQDKLHKLSHEKMVSEIVELMDSIEDDLDKLIVAKVTELRPKKLSKKEPWWE